MAQGYKDFTAGAILTAADLEDYNQNQSTMRFASAAARDTALSVVKTEGMRAYLIDVNTETIYTGAAWSTIGPVHGALPAWTPVVVQGATPTLTVSYSTYQRIGRMVYFQTVVSITSAGTASNVVTISLPVTALNTSTYQIIGNGVIVDASAVLKYNAQLRFATTTTMKFDFVGASTDPSYLGLTNFTAALASGDIISATGQYEAGGDA